MPYKKAERLGSFRRFALAFWRAPQDGVIYGSLNLDASNMVALFKKVEAEHGVKLTPGHIVGKAVALGLKASPQLNSKVIWGTVYQKDTVDVFFQVDVENGKDLSGVLIENADKKSVVEIAKELREKAANLRAGKDKQYEKTQKGFLRHIPPFILRRILNFLTFLEFNLGLPLTMFPGYKEDAFGTAMCTNVGMMGIDVAYAPLIPVMRVGVVALVGKIHDAPRVVNGKIEVRPSITGSATFDHRLGDGAQIGLFVRTARDFIENPYAEPTAVEGVGPLGAATKSAPSAADEGAPTNGAAASATPGSSVPANAAAPTPLPVV